MSSAFALALITLGTAIVNGALGYGISSITIPLALLFLTNRVLNPALVLIKVALNPYVSWINRGCLRLVWCRLLSVLMGLFAGIIVGTIGVTRIDTAWLKLWTFGALLSLILIQPQAFAVRFKPSGRSGFRSAPASACSIRVTTICGPRSRWR